MDSIDSKAANRREIKGTFVRPWAQIRYVGLLNLGWVAVSILILSISGGYLRQSILNVASLANLAPESRGELLSLVDRWLWIAILCVVTSALIAFFHSLWYSHRVFGPLVPLRRMIEDLKDGRYAARVRFRKKDELQEVMTLMNELAASLEARHGAGGETPDPAKPQFTIN